MADEILAKALGAIGRKERTESEMTAWLREREVEEEEVDRVIAFLIENEALDDQRFAIAFANDKRELSGWGSDRIEEVLRKRGIRGDQIRVALNQEVEVGEVDRAVGVLLAKRAQVDDPKDRQKALGLLARRGYCAEDAYAAIRRLETS